MFYRCAARTLVIAAAEATMNRLSAADVRAVVKELGTVEACWIRRIAGSWLICTVR